MEFRGYNFRKQEPDPFVAEEKNAQGSAKDRALLDQDIKRKKTKNKGASFTYKHCDHTPFTFTEKESGSADAALEQARHCKKCEKLGLKYIFFEELWV